MKEKECNSCKKRADIKFTWMTILSVYVMGTSIYGSVVLFNKISEFISSLF
jgi:hypothetical protein